MRACAFLLCGVAFLCSEAAGDIGLPSKSPYRTELITVDESLHLDECFNKSEYAWWDFDISNDGFPPDITARRKRVRVHFIRFAKAMRHQDALRALGEKRYRPATVRELLALAEEKPELESWQYVVAIGSPLIKRTGYEVPYLKQMHNGEPCLGLSWVSPWLHYDHRWYFLAVRK